MNYDELNEAIDKQNYNNYANVVHIPPTLESLEPRPILLDLCFQNFNYPDLTEKAKQQDGKGGLFSRAFGYFFKNK